MWPFLIDQKSYGGYIVIQPCHVPHAISSVQSTHFCRRSPKGLFADWMLHPSLGSASFSFSAVAKIPFFTETLAESLKGIGLFSFSLSGCHPLDSVGTALGNFPLSAAPSFRFTHNNHLVSKVKIIIGFLVGSTTDMTPLLQNRLYIHFVLAKLISSSTFTSQLWFAFLGYPG